MRRKQFKVSMRRKGTGEECSKVIFAEDEATARERAPMLTRRSLKIMADRQYAESEVIARMAQS
jgi:hypothetical protein